MSSLHTKRQSSSRSVTNTSCESLESRCLLVAPIVTAKSLDHSGNPFASPQWLDANGDGDPEDAGDGDHQYPLAYTRSGIGNVDVNATALPSFKIAKPAQGEYKIRGLSQFRGVLGGAGFVVAVPYFSEATATVNGNVLSPAGPLTASRTLPSVILKDKMSIRWQMQVRQGENWSEWQDIGTTDNTLYVTGVDVDLIEPVFHTVLDISCEAAEGKAPTNATEKDSIVDAIWYKFERRELHRAGDGKLLKYWGSGGITADIFSTAQLLSNQTGDGKCNAFSELLAECAAAQGVQGQLSRVAIFPRFRRPDRLDPGWTYPQGEVRGFRVNNMPAQGTGTGNAPWTDFGDHAVVEQTRADGKEFLLDPSYGRRYEAGDRAANEAAWEKAALSKRLVKVIDPDGLPDTGATGLGAPGTNVGFVYPPEQ